MVGFWDMTTTPHAEVLDLGLPWDGGAPLPQLITDGSTAVVLCYGQLASQDEERHVIRIAFEGCASVRMGHPNDEVLHGHPLWGHGLELYEAHLIHDSPFLAEHRRINAQHAQHSDAHWDELHHYLLVFHDEVVEVLAEGISATRVAGDLGAAVAQAATEFASRTE